VNERIKAALDEALRFLETSQLPSGELPIYAFAGGDPSRASLDPAIFPSALAALCLSFWPPAQRLRARICDFLIKEMDPNGLWRHWPSSHPLHRSLPPDLDDTSCASAALATAQLRCPDNRQLLLANRDGDGLFLTWLIPRLRWSGAAHVAVTWRQVAHLPTLVAFFRKTSAAPADVDAVVNANALFYLRTFPGSDAVVAALLAVLRENRERLCDKWYDNPFVIWYFIARALAGKSEEGERLLLAKLAAALPATALDSALCLSARMTLGERPGPDAVSRLLRLQQRDGSWPSAPLYHGGRARLPGGAFAAVHPDTPHWGSEALTTAFVVEALGRFLQAAA
jgi:hypothetical protein